MSDFEGIITDNDYKIIVDGLQSSKNIRQKANLNQDSLNTCLVSHTLEWIKIKMAKGEVPSIAEMMEVAAGIREELSLSSSAFGLKTFEKIMTSEHGNRDRFAKDKKNLEVE